MTTDLRALLKATLRGTLSADEMEHAVAERWAAHDFVHHLPADAIPPLGPTRGRVGRYGFTTEVVSEQLYGEVGEPGCLVITTPDPGRYDRSFRRLLVPPHVHNSAHIAVVISGNPLWVAVCPTGQGDVVVAEPMSPGSMAFYPRGVPHTFIADETFVVATSEARLTDPESEDFARPSPVDCSRLPRMNYEEWRAVVCEGQEPEASVGS